MAIKILCRPSFTDEEIASIDAQAKRLGMTREEFVRRAVYLFASTCVPTQHSRKAKGAKKL